MYEIFTTPQIFNGSFEQALEKSVDPNRKFYGEQVKLEYDYDGYRFAYAPDRYRYILKGEKRYVSQEAASALQGGQRYQWVNENGDEVSPRFFSNLVPKRVEAVDIDTDGDEDLMIEYTNGTTGISYNICAQMLSAKMYVDGSTELRDEVKFWMKDHFPKLAERFGYTPLSDLFQMRALPQQLWGEVKDTLANNELNPTQKIDAVREVTAKFTNQYADLNDSTNPRPNNVLPFLGSIINQWKYDKIQKTFLLNYLGADTSYTELEIEYAFHFINSMTDMFVGVVARSNQTLEQIGRSDAGIGMIYNAENEIKGYVEITAILPQSPAAEAKLQVEDKIIAIDGKSVTSLRDAEINRIELLKKSGQKNEYQYGSATKKAITGVINTKVKLSVKRGDETLSFEINRGFNLAPISFERGR